MYPHPAQPYRGKKESKGRNVNIETEVYMGFLYFPQRQVNDVRINLSLFQETVYHLFLCKNGYRRL
jgi:hypothetical protein